MTLILTQAEVRRVLPMDECISLMVDVLKAFSEGKGLNPLRGGMSLPDGVGSLLTMPGYMQEPKALGLKVIGVFPGNEGTVYESIQGLVMAFDPDHGIPLAIMDAGEITAIRTAAASGAATKCLAKEEASDLAILGSGVQARSHLEAMLCARSIARVRVYSPTKAHRDGFADEAARRHGIPVEATTTSEEAVRGADLICAVTSSGEPGVKSEWVAPGAHINAVGAYTPSTRELDTDTVARSRLFVDSRESALAEAGDFLIPKEEGAIGEDHLLGELGSVLLGAIPGREGPDDVTVFKSLGIAMEDVASAHQAYQRAKEGGVGTDVALEGLRQG